MTERANINIQNRTKQRQPHSVRRSAIDLGDTRSESFGEWLYAHRIGLVVVLVVYAVGIYLLFTARVNVEIPPVEYTIEFVEEEPTVEELEQLRRQRDKLQEDIDRRLAAMQQVRNLQSNDASESAGSTANTNFDAETQELMSKVASDMATNNDSYQSGMRDIAGIGKGGSGSGNAKGDGTGDKGKFSGAVTVSYSFQSPVRNHRNLYVPAYRSKGGGVVVVDVWIDRNGTVTTARIASSTNSELNQQALSAARNSRTLFDINNSAPAPQRGTITYTFVAQ